MNLRLFLRPSLSTVLVSLAITTIATVLLYATLLCALNGSGNCFRLPVAAQVILLLALWPWLMVVRLASFLPGIAASALGIIAAFAWVYLCACAVRAIIARKKRL